MDHEYIPLFPVSPTQSQMETPILSVINDEQAETPLPGLQMTVLLLSLLCEPASAFVIYPFVTKLVSELDITGDGLSIGYYVGLIESLFYFAQGLTVLQWGRLSDRIGRRPVILIGQLGLAVSLITFGYSSTFAWVIIGRSLAGFLDGNIGVVKTMLGELTDDTNRARTFRLFPVMWILGTTVAPLIGGALEHPADKFPTIFGTSGIWEDRPYLLPCLVTALLCLFTFMAGVLCLKETLQTKAAPNSDENGYYSLPQESLAVEEGGEVTDATSRSCRTPSMRDAMIRPVLFAALNYVNLAMLDIAYFSIAMVFYAVPVSAGGLNFTPFRIGIIFASSGIVSGSVQIFLFPRLHKIYGTKRIFCVSIASFLIIFALFPLMHLSAKRFGPNSIAVWILIIILMCMIPLVDMGYSCSLMFVTSSSPAPNLLGSVNGLVQTLVSMVRAIGPAGTTALFSLSTDRHWMSGYAVYWMMCGLTAGALWCTTLLPESKDAAK